MRDQLIRDVPGGTVHSARRGIVDAHHHLWDVQRNYHPWLRDEPPIPFRYGSYQAIRRNYLHADYLLDSARYEMLGSVYVETEWDPADSTGEMAFVSELRRQGGLPTVAVAHVPLDAPDAPDRLAAQCRHAFVRSIRHKPRANPTPGMPQPGGMCDPRWQRGYAALAELGLRFDLQTPWWHLHEARDLLERHADTPIIINHAGLPSDRSREGLKQWRSAVQAISRWPHVFMKISGIGVPGQPWTHANNREVVETLIECWGVERCMFASNFPVDSLCGSFDDIFGGFEALTASLGAPAQDALFRGNAIRIYDMELHA
jgi:predicted TIM-barrel fold metal-dependent hydrolase